MSIEKIINSIIDTKYTNSVSTLIKKALTLNYHISENDCIRGLSMAEQYIYKYIKENNDINIYEDGNFVLAFEPHGKFHILEKFKFEQYHLNYKLLAYLNLDDDITSYFQYLYKKQNDDLIDSKTQIIDYFHKNTYSKVCLSLLDLIQHMAPLIYYVNDYCFANFYTIGKNNNELSNTLENVIKDVLAQKDSAKIEYLNLVYCIDILLQSGTYTRLEEMNSHQLNLSTLKTFFYRKA